MVSYQYESAAWRPHESNALWPPNPVSYNARACKDHSQSLLLKAALIEALTTAGQPGVTQTGSQQHRVMNLDGNRIGKQTALPRAYIRTMSIMFKITQNTIRQFTLAEILLMAAMNEINAKQRTFERTGQARRDPLGVGQ